MILPRRPRTRLHRARVVRFCSCGPVAHGESFESAHRFYRWKTLVSARRANKVVPVRTKCRYIFYTRYRQHLQPRSSSFCSLSLCLRLSVRRVCSLARSSSLCLSPRASVLPAVGMWPAVKASWHPRLAYTLLNSSRILANVGHSHSRGRKNSFSKHTC